MSEQKEAINNVTRFSGCLPKPLYTRLIEVLRSPLSIAPEGKLDKGVMATWLRDCATTTVVNKGRMEMMELFLAQKGLTLEFAEFYSANIDEGFDLETLL